MSAKKPGTQSCEPGLNQRKKLARASAIRDACGMPRKEIQFEFAGVSKELKLDSHELVRRVFTVVFDIEKRRLVDGGMANVQSDREAGKLAKDITVKLLPELAASSWGYRVVDIF